MTTKKPNILILWGDDIGLWNISHFSRGMMGYRTPNIGVFPWNRKGWLRIKKMLRSHI
jgi:hypothetical protein